jgi:hypothetical protein
MALQHPLVTLACIAMLCTATPAAAQSAVTLYGGLRGGSGLHQSDPPNAEVAMSTTAAGSVAIEWPNHDARPFQLFFSTQRTKLDLHGSTTPGSPSEMSLQVSYLHIGGLNFFEGLANGGGPYVVGGLGATFLDPKLQGTSSVVRPSINLGLGYQWPLGPSVSLRTELRGYITVINGSTSLFCAGGCVVKIQGDTLTQFEGMVGLTFGF